MKLGIPFFAVLLMVLGHVFAQSPIRKYNLIRYQDDFSFLRNDSLRQEFFDPVKFIPLSPNKTSWLSLGGELRHQYQLYHYPRFGPDKGDANGHFLQRYMFHADLHRGPHFRIFSQMNSGILSGRSGGPRPQIDHNPLELYHLFAQYSLHLGHSNLLFRVGHFEKKIGAVRLVGPREGQNVRRIFEGGELILQAKHWDMNLFSLQPIISSAGVFDDNVKKKERLSGILARFRTNEWVWVEPYFFVFSQADAQFGTRTGHELRYTPGIRIHNGNGKTWNWEGELIVQYGKFDQMPIRTWLVAGRLRRNFPSLIGRPYVMAEGSIATGERNRQDRFLNTFNAFYPKPLLGQSLPLSPANLLVMHLEAGMVLANRIQFSLHDYQLFRYAGADVFYTPGRKPILPLTDSLSTSLAVGNQAGLKVRLLMGIHYYVEMEEFVFFPAAFLKEEGKTKNLTYFSLKSVFRF